MACQDIMNQQRLICFMERLVRASKQKVFLILDNLMHDFTNAAILVAECLYDYYQTGEL